MKKYLLFYSVIILIFAAFAGCGTEEISEDAAEEAFSSDALVSQAKEASGEEEAKALYEQALEAEPYNEDALRGMLAIIEGQDAQREAELYSALESAGYFAAEDYAALYEFCMSAENYAEAFAALERGYIITGGGVFSDMLYCYDSRALPGQEVFASLEGYLLSADISSAVSLVSSPEWAQAYSSLIPGDKRITHGDAMKVVCAGDVTKVWILKEDALTYMLYSPEGFVFGTSGYDGDFNGSFSSRYAAAAEGDVYEETGTFLSGKADGELMSMILWGEPTEDVPALASADMSGAVSYTGTFSSGVPNEPGLEDGAKIPEGETAYAVSEDGEKFLSLPDVSEFTFAEFGFDAYPEW